MVPYKTLKLRNIAHHVTSIDYNENLGKILISTLNEKVQMHSVDPEVTKFDTIKIKKGNSGHFLLEPKNK